MIIVKQEGYSAIVIILGTVSGESVSQWSSILSADLIILYQLILATLLVAVVLLNPW